VQTPFGRLIGPVSVQKIRNLKKMKRVQLTFPRDDVRVGVIDGPHLFTLEPCGVSKDILRFIFKHHAVRFNCGVDIIIFASRWSAPH